MTTGKKSAATTIRVDREVYEWLQKRGEPFRDSPNSVLRRLTNLDGPPGPDAPRPHGEAIYHTPSSFTQKILEHYMNGEVSATLGECCEDRLDFGGTRDWQARFWMFGDVLHIEITHARCVGTPQRQQN